MARGPKKHLKRIAAPKSWMLSKLSGIYTVRPSQGPHKLRESLPLSVLLRYKLKYALFSRDVKMILNDKEGHIKVDGKVRTDAGFPTGLMDVLSIEKTGEHYRIFYDVAGRFVLKSIKSDEAQFKLCQVKAKQMGPNKIPYLVTNDGRTIRFPHPDVHIGDTVKVKLDTGKVIDHFKCEQGNLCYIIGGNNVGRIGLVQHREKHEGGFDIIHVKDANGHDFSTRALNVFIIGKGKKPQISIPEDQGLYLGALEKKQKHEHQLEEQNKDKKH